MLRYLILHAGCSGPQPVVLGRAIQQCAFATIIDTVLAIVCRTAGQPVHWPSNSGVYVTRDWKSLRSSPEMMKLVETNAMTLKNLLQFSPRVDIHNSGQLLRYLDEVMMACGEVSKNGGESRSNNTKNLLLTLEECAIYVVLGAVRVGRTIDTLPSEKGTTAPTADTAAVVAGENKRWRLIGSELPLPVTLKRRLLLAELQAGFVRVTQRNHL